MGVGPDEARKLIDDLLGEFLGDAANNPELQEAKEEAIDALVRLRAAEADLDRAERAARLLGIDPS